MSTKIKDIDDDKILHMDGNFSNCISCRIGFIVQLRGDFKIMDNAI